MDTKSILIVDDEISSTEVLAFILREEGFQVTAASNGRQALDRLDVAAPDLIITDYMMPVMNGVEMAKAVRRQQRYARLPILMMSGVGEAALRSHGHTYDRFLRKPFDLEALLESVQALLSQT